MVLGKLVDARRKMIRRYANSMRPRGRRSFHYAQDLYVAAL